MHMRAFAHLPIVLHCYDVIIFLGRKVAQIENNGLGRWLNANPYGQSVIRIFRIAENTIYNSVSVYANNLYDTLVIFSNLIITHREPLTGPC